MRIDRNTTKRTREGHIYKNYGYLVEERLEMQPNYDCFYMELVNREVSQTQIENYNEWEARRQVEYSQNRSCLYSGVICLEIHHLVVLE